jgi:hypothetical protein
MTLPATDAVSFSILFGVGHMLLHADHTVVVEGVESMPASTRKAANSG